MEAGYIIEQRTNICKYAPMLLVFNYHFINEVVYFPTNENGVNRFRRICNKDLV